MTDYEEQISESTCFGIAFDTHATECGVCQAKLRCEAKCRMSMSAPPAPITLATPEEISTLTEKKVTPFPNRSTNLTSDEADKAVPFPKSQAEPDPLVPTLPKDKTPEKKKAKRLVDKPPVQYADDMPDFKTLELSELEKMAVDRGAVLADFDKFKAPNIRRMRLTMFVKKTYEVK